MVMSKPYIVILSHNVRVPKINVPSVAELNSATFGSIKAKVLIKMDKYNTGPYRNCAIA